MEDLSLKITSVFGKRVGSFSTTEVEDATLERSVRRAEESAMLAPENPEYMPRLGPQQYVAPAQGFAQQVPPPQAANSPPQTGGQQQQGGQQAQQGQQGQRGQEGRHRTFADRQSIKVGKVGGIGQNIFGSHGVLQG